MRTPAPSFITAIGGPTCAGKTTLARAIVRVLTPDRAVILSLDSYYRDLSSLEPSVRAARNFDAPDAMDWPLLITHLDALRSGHAVRAPVYDFVLHTRSDRTLLLSPREFVIVEGLLALHCKDLRDRCDLKIFVSAANDTSFSRRRERDVAERGRSPDSVVRQYKQSVEPMARRYVIPSRAHADLVVDGNADLHQSVQSILDRMVALRPPR